MNVARVSVSAAQAIQPCRECRTAGMVPAPRIPNSICKGERNCKGVNVMKKLITAAALVTVMVSPAFAQKHRMHHAQAYPPAQSSLDNGFTGDPHGQIIWGSKVRGQDPDWFIRSQITRGLGNYGDD
jgi:hypothetical protein